MLIHSFMKKENFVKAVLFIGNCQGTQERQKQGKKNLIDIHNLLTDGPEAKT